MVVQRYYLSSSMSISSLSFSLLPSPFLILPLTFVQLNSIPRVINDQTTLCIYTKIKLVLTPKKALPLPQINQKQAKPDLGLKSLPCLSHTVNPMVD